MLEFPGVADLLLIGFDMGGFLLADGPGWGRGLRVSRALEGVTQPENDQVFSEHRLAASTSIADLEAKLPRRVLP